MNAFVHTKLFAIRKWVAGTGCSASILVLLFACRSSHDPQAAVLATRHAGYTLPVNSVALLDPQLERVITVEANNSRRSPTQTLEVLLTLRNRRDDPMRLTARARFLDADKNPLEASQWRELFFERRGLQTYTVLSTQREAVYYYVELQPTR